MQIHGIKTWIESGELKVVEDDVLFIVQRVREFSPRLTVFWNEYINEFTITETDLEGTERLVFNTPCLDERVLDRLRMADQWRGRDDPDHVLPADTDWLADVERKEAEAEQLKDEVMREGIREFGEEYAHYMEYDGRGTKSSILVPRSLDG